MKPAPYTDYTIRHGSIPRVTERVVDIEDAELFPEFAAALAHARALSAEGGA